MNIIIPMAGLGKRMRPHTLTTPKPLIPIAGKPMVHRIVEDIAATSNQPIQQIAFVIHPSFGAEAEKSLLEVAARFGAEGKIFYQQEPLGTAHAILCAADCLQGPVFIAFSDTLFKADFKIDASKDAIIWTQQVEDPSAFGVVQMNADGRITAFVEKPTTFVSDLAIIGVYYFREGERLRDEMQYLLDHDIKIKGEYQLTDAMENMKQKGVQFYSDQVEEWLDCGNKDATLYTLGRILEIKSSQEQLIHPDAQLQDCIILPPCFIGEGVQIRQSVIGPHTAIEAGAIIENSHIENSLIGKQTRLKYSLLKNAMLGNHVTCHGQPDELNLGDYSVSRS